MRLTEGQATRFVPGQSEIIVIFLILLLVLPCSPRRVRAAPPVHLQARGDHCHLHLRGPGGAPAADHLAEERADPGDQRPHKAEE